MALCHIVSAVAALALACTDGAPLDGACPPPAAKSSTEDLEESGLVQSRPAGQLQRPRSCPAEEGRKCIVASEACSGGSCPCAAGLTCVPNAKKGGCKGRCRRVDGQWCFRDEQCAGGVCAGCISGGLCKTRTGSFAIDLIDVSGGFVDQNPQIGKAFQKARARYVDLIEGQTIFPRDLTTVILYSVEPIDGEGTIVGFAGPAAVDSEPFDGYGERVLPVAGMMVFDIDDLLLPEIAPLVESIILHEMAHVLGFGSVGLEPSVFFASPPIFYDISDCIKSGGVDGRYKSLDGFATSAYLRAKGYIPTGLPSDFTRASLPPLETDFGPGNQCGHWDVATLFNELMTGFLFPADFGNPLSIVTCGAFEDLGYAVNYEACDRYEVPVSASVLSSARAPQGFDMSENITHPAVNYIGHGQRSAEGGALNHTYEELRKFRLAHATKSGGAPPQ